MWSVITVDVSLMKKLLKNISLGAKTSKKWRALNRLLAEDEVCDSSKKRKKVGGEGYLLMKKKEKISTYIRKKKFFFHF
jgi:hypothetical protein